MTFGETPRPSHKLTITSTGGEMLKPSHKPWDFSKMQYEVVRDKVIHELLPTYTLSVREQLKKNGIKNADMHARNITKNAESTITLYCSPSPQNEHLKDLLGYLSGTANNDQKLSEGLKKYWSSILVTKLNFGVKDYMRKAGLDRQVNDMRLTQLKLTPAPMTTIDGVKTNAEIYAKTFTGDLFSHNAFKEALLSGSTMVSTQHLPSYFQGVSYGFIENIVDNLELLKLLKDPMLALSAMEELLTVIPKIFKTLYADFGDAFSGLSQENIYPFARFVGQILGYLMPSLPGIKIKLKHLPPIVAPVSGINLKKTAEVARGKKINLEVIFKNQNILKTLTGNIAQQVLVDAQR